MPGMKSYSPTINQLRLPLIVLITFAHSYSGVRTGWTLWDGGWDTYEMLKLVVSETLVKIAMPTFFVMSGYLYFVNVTEWNAKIYWNKLRRRAPPRRSPSPEGGGGKSVRQANA